MVIRIIIFSWVSILIMGCQSTDKNQSYQTKKSSCQEYSNSTIKPIVRVQPKYPREAVRSKLSGYTKMEFDVSSDGKPINIKVVESYPKGIFNKNSIVALSKWRYSEKETKCKWVRLDFKLKSN